MKFKTVQNKNIKILRKWNNTSRRALNNNDVIFIIFSAVAGFILLVTIAITIALIIYYKRKNIPKNAKKLFINLLKFHNLFLIHR